MSNVKTRQSGNAGHQQFKDNAGHMDPEHAARLRGLSGSSGNAADDALLDDAAEDDLAEALGELTLANATSGQQERLSASTLDELGGLSIYGEAEMDDIDIDIESAALQRRARKLGLS